MTPARALTQHLFLESDENVNHDQLTHVKSADRSSQKLIRVQWEPRYQFSDALGLSLNRLRLLKQSMGLVSDNSQEFITTMAQVLVRILEGIIPGYG